MGAGVTRSPDLIVGTWGKASKTLLLCGVILMSVVQLVLAAVQVVYAKRWSWYWLIIGPVVSNEASRPPFLNQVSRMGTLTSRSSPIRSRLDYQHSGPRSSSSFSTLHETSPFDGTTASTQASSSRYNSA